VDTHANQYGDADHNTDTHSLHHTHADGDYSSVTDLGPDFAADSHPTGQQR
jgi:hypothetical protein